MERIQDLCSKEVIDIFDGKRLGCVGDCEVDILSGRLTAIIVPGGGFGLWKNDDYIIPWCNIKKIGEDIILVDTHAKFVNGAVIV
ncbi:MAG: YlmC/YmxH family sporulation protein [Clostridiales bacterium]|jgi:YlmC/YmxH family sporulation protein|nr:YlmC/YmxH family sporulation protein [Clostridiales bacterium]